VVQTVVALSKVERQLVQRHILRVFRAQTQSAG
jgi:hypothetical protein